MNLVTLVSVVSILLLGLLLLTFNVLYFLSGKELDKHTGGLDA